MQVIEVVPTITTSEYIHLLVIAVSSMHITGARWNASHLNVKPPEAGQVQDMHVVRRQWSLTQPPSNYVKSTV